MAVAWMSAVISALVIIQHVSGDVAKEYKQSQLLEPFYARSGDNNIAYVCATPFPEDCSHSPLHIDATQNTTTSPTYIVTFNIRKILRDVFGSATNSPLLNFAYPSRADDGSPANMVSNVSNLFGGLLRNILQAIVQATSTALGMPTRLFDNLAQQTANVGNMMQSALSQLSGSA